MLGILDGARGPEGTAPARVCARGWCVRARILCAADRFDCLGFSRPLMICAAECVSTHMLALLTYCVRVCVRVRACACVCASVRVFHKYKRGACLDQ